MAESKPYFNITHEESYHDGQTIFEEGNSGDWVYVVLSGAVEVSKRVDGSRFVLSVIQPGEVLGELALVGAVKRTATTRAMGQTKLGIIDRELLDKDFNKLSSDFRNVLVVMVTRFVKMLDRSREFAVRSDERVTKTIALKFQNRQSFVNAYSANISSSGLFIKTDSPLPVGEPLSLQIEIPDVAEALKFRCEVVWTREKAEDNKPAGMGVKFCETSEKDSQILKQFIANTS
jgi:uncharacterized protein (TIGR02266 family)